MHRVVALQAQEPATPYLALWNRLEQFDPASLDRAFAEQTVVKASLMRITMHTVEAADYPAFHEAMQRTLPARSPGRPALRALVVQAAERPGSHARHLTAR